MPSFLFQHVLSATQLFILHILFFNIFFFRLENSRRTYLAIAAAAIAVGSMKYLFPEKEENKAEAKKEETKKATDSAAEAAAAAAAAAAAEETAEKAKKAAEYAAAEKALYEQDGPAAADETAGTEAPAPATTEKEEEKEAAEEEDDAPIVPEAVKFVVCFDFDKCLMSDHWWGRYKNADIKGNSRPLIHLHTLVHMYGTATSFRGLSSRFIFFSCPHHSILTSNMYYDSYRLHI